MQLRSWRLSHDKTLRDLADGLGIGGANPSRTVQRLETGEAYADADMIERIAVFTDGAVTGDDLYASRLTWLRANRPEKFETPLPKPFASEAAA